MPSPATAKIPSYVRQGPPSSRYTVVETPLWSSVASRAMFTALETNQPLRPGVPESVAVVTGGNPSGVASAGAERGPSPTAFVAETRYTYVTPFETLVSK